MRCNWLIPCLQTVGSDPHVSAQVTAGTVNYEGPVTVRATSTGADATLAGIARLVADAQVCSSPRALLSTPSLALLVTHNARRAAMHRSKHSN